MARVIVKNGAVAVSGGRVVTDAGGAPCCCGPGGGDCWLILLPCNCDDPTAIRYLLLTDAVEAAWPFEDRQAGSVVILGGICWRLAGSTTTPDLTREIEFILEDTAESCDVAPCDVEGCPPCPGGFTIRINPGIGFPVAVRFVCAQFYELACVAKVEVWHESSKTFRYRSNLANSSGIAISVDQNIDQVFSATFTSPFEVEPDWSFTESVRGANRKEIDGVLDEGYDWDYAATYTEGGTDPCEIASRVMYDKAVSQPLLSGDAVLYDCIDNPNSLPGFYRQWGPSAVQQSRASNAACGGPTTFETGSSRCRDSAGIQTSSTVYQSLTRSSVTMSWTERIQSIGFPSNECEVDVEVDFTMTLNTRRRITLIDGTVIEDNDCDIPVPMLSIAVACDVDADPQEITYDAQLLPEWAESLIEIETGLRYIPTDIPSNDTPLPVVYEAEGCPEPPIDDSDLYYIARCGSNTPVEQIPQLGEPGGPAIVNRTVAYQPGDGLVAGEGWVPITSLGPNGCLFAGRGQPTTIPYPADQQPDIVLRSDSGTCRGVPFVNVDPRSQCQQTDGGGGGGTDAGGPQPSDSNALSDSTDTGSMGLGDAVERAIKTITLNQLATCPACQRRKEVLNQFGLTVGRAVLRRLGW